MSLHPDPVALALDPMSTDVADHVAACAACAAGRRALRDSASYLFDTGALGASVAEAHVRAGSAGVVVRRAEQHVLRLSVPIAADRLAGLLRFRHPGAAAWLAGDGHEVVVEAVEGPAIDLAAPPSGPWVADVVATLAAMHAAGLAHGAVGIEALRVVGARVVLCDPAPVGSEAAEDWRALGALVDGPVGVALRMADPTAILAALVPAVRDHRAAGLRVVGPLGRGGMGDVHEVFDARLGRTVAMKALRPDRLAPRWARLFEGEAQRAARLEHPGLVPVHESGVLPDGRPYFTMRVVRGHTLREQLLRQPPTDRIGLRRAVDVLRRVAETVAFAHAAQVVHRDLKPDNVMIGAFGEVTVIDWGLAIDADDPAAAPAGTPAYLPPEVVAGGPADARGDVYALGVMLYEVLVGHPPWFGPPSVVLAGVRSGPPPPPSGAAPLVALCDVAMARAPEARPDAAALAASLQGWLDGDERAAEAERLVVAADAAADEARARRAEAAALRAEAAAALAHVRPFDPVAIKAPAWAIEDAAARVDDAAERAEADHLELLRIALDHDPEHEPARARRAAFHADALVAAERREDRREAIRHARALAAEGPRFAGILSAKAALTLVTDPEGADVVAWPLSDAEKRRVEGPPVALGRTPLREVTIAPGSWVLSITPPGGDAVRYPIVVARGQLWDAIRPGDGLTTPVRLAAAVAGARYVPAGWAEVGGDPDAVDALPALRVWVDGFFLQTHPVTVGAYLGFLNDLVASGRAAEAARHQPAAGAGTGPGRDPIFARHDGTYRVAPDAPPDWGLACPVVQVELDGMEAYAAWFAARTGQPWALPHELQWEKAARGVDRRVFPWGNGFDPALVRMQLSQDGPPGRASVFAYPTDVSPYGVAGLGGNVRDACANAWSRGSDVSDGGILSLGPPAIGRRVVRGGSCYSAASLCRAAGRLAFTFGSTSTGFRLAVTGESGETGSSRSDSSAAAPGSGTGRRGP